MLGRNPVHINGVIIDLDESNHIASIKYLDENNEEQIETVSYIDLINSL